MDKQRKGLMEEYAASTIHKRRVQYCGFARGWSAACEVAAACAPVRIADDICITDGDESTCDWLLGYRHGWRAAALSARGATADIPDQDLIMLIAVSGRGGRELQGIPILGVAT